MTMSFLPRIIVLGMKFLPAEQAQIQTKHLLSHNGHATIVSGGKSCLTGE